MEGKNEIQNFNKSGDFQGGTPVMLKPLSKSRSPPFVALENHPSSSTVTLQKEDSPSWEQGLQRKRERITSDQCRK